MRFPQDTEKVLKDAGWFSGRRVADEQMTVWRTALDSESGFQMFPAAQAALLEFGGLEVKRRGPGLTSARLPFHLDPTLAIGEEDRFSKFESVLQTRLYPLGEVADGHSFLAVAENGEAFLAGDDLFFAGKTIDEALERLTLGLSVQRLDLTIHREQDDHSQR